MTRAQGGCARGRHARRARKLRQARRLSRRARARCSRRGGRARRTPSRARWKPGRRRRARQSRGLARRRGAAADAGRGAPPARRRSRLRRAGDDRRGTREAAEASDADPRPAARADVRLRASCNRRGHPRAADAADHSRPRRGGDRLRVSGFARRDGPAAGAREGEDPTRGRAVPHSGAEELPERLGAVLEAIYAAFAHGWAEAFADDPRGRNLAEEAVWLGRVVVRARPERARGARAARADALCRFPPRGPARRRGALCPAQRAGTRAGTTPRSRRPRACCARGRAAQRPGGSSWRPRSSRRTPRAASTGADGLARHRRALRRALRADGLARRRGEPRGRDRQLRGPCGGAAEPRRGRGGRRAFPFQGYWAARADLQGASAIPARPRAIAARSGWRATPPRARSCSRVSRLWRRDVEAWIGRGALCSDGSLC